MSGVFRVVRAEGSRDYVVAYEEQANTVGLRSHSACLAAAVMAVGVGISVPGVATAEPATYCVSGAGTSGANGTYVNGINQANSSFMLSCSQFGAPVGTSTSGNSFVDACTILDSGSGNVYAYASAGTSPLSSPWVSGNACTSVIGDICTGLSPAPTVTEFACDDDDGVSATIEDNVPNPSGGSGDGNGDGTQDSLQSSVTSLPAAVGNVYVTVEAPSGSSLSSVSTSSPSGLPSGVTAPYGAVNFTATGFSGSSATFSIFVPYNASINGAVKYNRQTSAWDRIGTVTQVGDKTKITYTLVDGGPYDSDGSQNGTIVDPIVPAGFSSSTVAVPTLSEWGVLTLSGLVALATLRRVRRRGNEHGSL